MPTAAVSPTNSTNYLGFIKQAAKGTGLQPTAFFGAFIDAPDVNPNHTVRRVREAGGGVHIARSLKDTYAPGATFSIPARPDIIGAALALHMGDDTISGAGDPYTHTIVPSTTNLWVSLERNINDEVTERLIDALFTEVIIDARKRDQGPEIMAAVTATALTVERQATQATPVYETGRPYLRSDAAWTIDQSVATNVESATITSRWTVDEAIYADGLTRIDFAKLQYECEVEVVQLFNSTAELNAYIATHYGTTSGVDPAEGVYGPNATNSFDLDLNYTDGANRQLKINLPGVDWEAAELTEPNPEAGEAVRLTRRGFLSQGTTPTVTVQNANATAYDA